MRLLGAGSQRQVLEDFCAAVETGCPVGVLDSGWPAAAQQRARRDVAAALGDGRVRSGDIVVFSSGSTGRPRGLVRTVESWLASVEPLRIVLELRPDDVVGIPGPLSSSLYLYAAWHAVTLGHEVVLADEWAAASARVSVVHAVPGRVRGWAHLPPGLRRLVLAGDRVDPDLRAQMSGAGVGIVEYYGSAEASFVLVTGEPGTALRAFPGVQVRVGDDQRLWSRSPFAFTGYLNREGPACWDGGWLTVGDLARPSGAGLELLGRPGTISTGGHTVLVAEVEAFLSSLPGVRAAVVSGVRDARLGQVVAALVETDLNVSVVRDLARRLPAPARPRRWLVVAVLPRTAAGKPDRAACAEAIGGSG